MRGAGREEENRGCEAIIYLALLCARRGEYKIFSPTFFD